MQRITPIVPPPHTYGLSPDTTNPIAIAIIIPVYNVEEFLQQCIESVLQQTLHNIIIICIDDGSTDNSLTLLQQYTYDNRLHILRQENKGQGAARNKGIEYAFQYNPEYLGFVDSDDYIEKDFFLTLYNKAIASNADMVYTQQTQRYNQNTKEFDRLEVNPPTQELFSPQEYDDNFLNLKFFAPWGAIYRTSMIAQHHIYFPHILYEDVLWSVATFLSSSTITSVKDAGYIYRIDRAGNTSDSLSNIGVEKQLYTLFYLYISCTKLLITYNAKKQYYENIQHFILSLLYKVLRCFPQEEKLCLQYIKTGFPYPIYIKIVFYVIKRYIKRILSVQRDYRTHQKKLFILGFKIPL